MTVTLLTTIPELGTVELLSVRTTNVLRAARIDTLGELLEATEYEMKTWRNCGRKSILEITELQKKYDYLRAPLLAREKEDMIASAMETFQENLQAQDRQIFAILLGPEPVSETTLPERLTRVLERLRQMDLREVAQGRQLLLQSPINLFANPFPSEAPNGPTQTAVLQFRRDLDDVYFSAIMKAIPATVLPLLRGQYGHLFRAKSVRFQNRFKEFATFRKELLPHLYCNLMINQREMPDCGQKTMQEWVAFCGAARQLVDDALMKGRLVKLSSAVATQLAVQAMEMRFPFLLTKECQHMVELEEQGKPLPAFKILEKFLRRDSGKVAGIQREYYGLNSSHTSQTMDTIASQLGLSRERVRQLLAMKVAVPDGCRQLVTRIYQHFTSPVLTPRDPVWDRIRAEEGTSTSTFHLMAIAASFSEEWTTEETGAFADSSSVYLVQRHLLKHIGIKGALSEIKRLLALRRTDDETINLLHILYDGRHMEMFDPEVAQVCVILRDYFKDEPDFVPLPDNMARLCANRVERVGALEEILDQHGKEMTAEELFQAYNSRYPDEPIAQIGSLKSFLSRSRRILPVGKTGRYVMSHWPNIFTGSLTDYLAYVLQQFDEPMSLADLADFAREHSPNTNENSVNTLMGLDTQRRFVTFRGRLFGLRSKDYGETPLQIFRPHFRRSFDERFEQLKQFVREQGRKPFSSPSRHLSSDNQEETEGEDTLSRWIGNVQRGTVGTPEQAVRLAAYLDENALLPGNATEEKFRDDCDRVRLLVGRTFALPDRETNPDEYSFLKNNMRKSGTWNDNRTHYFDTLLHFLADYGFTFS